MLEEFYVMFKEDGFDAMTKGCEYLVTHNGCHLQSYRGHDDNGTAFCYSDDVFYPRAPTAPMTATQVQQRNDPSLRMLTPISPPSGDYSHMGRWQGTSNIEMTCGREYNLIYDNMSNTVAFMSDLGNWLSAEGNMFDVTHDYASHHAYPNQVQHNTHGQRRDGNDAVVQAKRAKIARAAAAPPPASDPAWDFDSDGGQSDIPAPDCDMTGITVTSNDKASWHDCPFNEDGDPAIAPGPASTEDLREYRFKPNLY